MRFQIVHVTPTEYEPSQDREKLQNLADELNRDAIDQEEKDCWIVVLEAVVGDLFER